MKKLVIGKSRSVALVYRPDTAEALTLAKALTAWLQERNYKVYTAPEQKPIAKTTYLRNRELLGKMSLIVVLGGDGTYLRAVRLLAGKIVPILGINLGSLGFLTPTRVEEAFTTVEQTLDNKMELRPRSMIEIRHLTKNKKKLAFLALNDIVIERGSMSQLINIRVLCENQLVSEVKADGLIIASPTGSTAYNLSAGGPILHPDTKAFVVTPIAPHALTSRPLIFPDDSKLSFKLVEKLQIKSGGSRKAAKATDIANVVVDGVKVCELSSEDELVVSRSSHDHLMVRDPHQNYFHLLRQKLKFGDRA